MQGKKVSESITVMNEIVLPNDTNVFGNLMGGQINVLDGYCRRHRCS